MGTVKGGMQNGILGNVEELEFHFQSTVHAAILHCTHSCWHSALYALSNLSSVCVCAHMRVCVCVCVCVCMSLHLVLCNG